jgi:aspartyl aminopeptidase
MYKTDDFLSFLNASMTTYHAAEEISRRLKDTGFTPLKEDQKWVLEQGKSYFVVRDQSLVCAFRMPKKEMSHLFILASHVDSPCLKLKPSPVDSSHEIGRFNTEIYGAPLLHTWLDRDLAIGGKIFFLKEDGKIHSKLIHLREYPITIPNLAL